MTNHTEEANRPFVVCPACRGEGYESKLGAFTGDDLDEWYGDSDERYEFIEDYTTRGGIYDQPCSECRGQRVVRDECECLDCQRDREEIYDLIAMERAERAFGC